MNGEMHEWYESINEFERDYENEWNYELNKSKDLDFSSSEINAVDKCVEWTT